MGPGRGASSAAAERQRKLQEYLAAKGKLKPENTKPYLKAKNNIPNPPASKSAVRPGKNVTSHVALPVKTSKPISIKVQPRPDNITRSQKPKLEPPKQPGKRPISGCISSNPTCKPSSKNQQQHEARPFTTGKLTRKPEGSLNIQQLETTEQPVTDQGHAKCADSTDNTHVEQESSDNFLKERNKENLPQTLPESQRKPAPELCIVSKAKTGLYNQPKSSYAHRKALSSSSVTRTVLKDRANKQFGGTQTKIIPVKSQQLPRGDLVRPGGKFPRTIPSHSVAIQASGKPEVKDTKVYRSNPERPTKAKLQSCCVTEQKAKPMKPRTYPSLVQGGLNNRHPNIKQDQTSTQSGIRPQTSCILPKTKTVNQKPGLTIRSLSSIVPSTPSLRANRANSNSVQQKAQTLDSKLKRTLPLNAFLSKTAPKPPTAITTANRNRDGTGAQTNPNIKMKTTAEDRRKQLEEWQKSKGKVYKRPPMEIKAKRKVIEEMNISFWKSIEKEEEEKKAQLELSSKINKTLTECLQLIEEGMMSDEILDVMSSIPEAEKFAKFWICKAKLLASKGPFDVIGLYEEAIKSGATPIQDLRKVVLNILQDSKRTTEGVTSDPSGTETDTASVEVLANTVESGQACLSPSPKEREQLAATPHISIAEQDSHSGIKLQVAPIPRVSGMVEVQNMKLITPVRRSARIERAVSRYPEMLQDHDLVVASLDELLEVEETEYFVFRKNEALPVTLGFPVLES
ncbi:cytoskeleton-associated protein 2-like [Ochotona curzoniae]|uniref:cytoskeleton-associated protein 2-like n=1 Tax=Ochotona curzoniae TaxID=130825 RepID=UPI001B353229|nr:cytoskeleton-associated protein 2-like [Ochotona curzoniae]